MDKSYYGAIGNFTNDNCHKKVNRHIDELVKKLIGMNVEDAKKEIKMNKYRYRVENPNDCYTMEYNDQRIRLIVDETNIVTRSIIG